MIAQMIYMHTHILLSTRFYVQSNKNNLCPFPAVSVNKYSIVSIQKSVIKKEDERFTRWYIEVDYQVQLMLQTLPVVYWGTGPGMGTARQPIRGAWHRLRKMLASKTSLLNDFYLL